MLRSYKGLTGLKTGYIREAGFCISASAEREELSLVAVVMAAPTKEDRMADAAALLNYGFANFTAWTPPEESCAAVPVTLGRADTVALRMEGDSVCVLEKSAVSTVEAERRVPESLTAPVEEGQQVGELIVRNGGETLLTVPLCAAGERGGGHGFSICSAVSCARSREQERDTRGGVFGMRTF